MGVHPPTLDRCKSANMWITLWYELREIAWLASVVTGLSLAGVGLAVVVAAV
jgi:hypothetical protein